MSVLYLLVRGLSLQAKQDEYSVNFYKSKIVNGNKILFVQSDPYPSGGGGTAVAVWMLAALRHDYEITILSCLPIDLYKVNRYYVTSLKKKDFNIYTMPRFIR